MIYMKFRYLNYLYARFFHYFWIVCPSCGEFFGGHEKKKSTLRHKGYIEIDGIKKIVCSGCHNQT